MDPSTPLESFDQLEAYFHDGSTPREEWKIGVEYEKPVVNAETGEAVPYEGPSGIGALLTAMLERSDTWEGVYENDDLIALRDGHASITLEPGGQFELSGRLCDSLHCAADELRDHVREVLAVGDSLGLLFLGLGAAPSTPLADLPWMPKERYRIMRRIMESTGSLGHRMMQQTATVQCNFDYDSEADAVQKMRLGFTLAPLLVAASANSPIVDGHRTAYKSFRAHVWSDTDAARCGFLPFVFETEDLFGAYTRYALDVPMYFVVRGKKLHPGDGRTFRDFMRNGMNGEQATKADWETHLTTLFPEVRLKTYIEVRSADSQAPNLMLGTPALMKGLFYNSDCLQAALDEVKTWAPNELPRLHQEAARHGLQAKVGRHTMQDYATEICAIATEGLKRQAVLDDEGRDETVYLTALADEIRAGRCPADQILEAWEGPWEGKLARLVEFTAYSRSDMP